MDTGALLAWKMAVMTFIIMKVNGQACRDRLGMESGAIPDASITASSFRGNGSEPYRARLNGVTGNGAWSSNVNAIATWLMVDLGQTKNVTGVVTQGRHQGNEWVKSYKLQFRPDNGSWIAPPKVYQGNKNSSTPVTNQLDSPVEARYVAFQVQSWSGHISMRVEILGCPADECPELTSPVNGRMNGSSAIHDVVTFSCDVGYSLQGAANVTCQSNGTWSNSVPNCTDDNECENGTHNCDMQATCVNKNGSFACTCNSGYSGDGVNCTASATFPIVPVAAGVAGGLVPLLLLVAAVVLLRKRQGKGGTKDRVGLDNYTFQKWGADNYSGAASKPK